MANPSLNISFWIERELTPFPLFGLSSGPHDMLVFGFIKGEFRVTIAFVFLFTIFV